MSTPDTASAPASTPTTAAQALSLHPKTTAASAGGALSMMIVWLLGLWHIQVDPVTASGLATVVAAFCAWLAPVIERETGGP